MIGPRNPFGGLTFGGPSLFNKKSYGTQAKQEVVETGARLMMQPGTDTNPDAMGGSFSSAQLPPTANHEGDSIYWATLDPTDAPYGFTQSGVPRAGPAHTSSTGSALVSGGTYEGSVVGPNSSHAGPPGTAVGETIATGYQTPGATPGSTPGETIATGYQYQTLGETGGGPTYGGGEPSVAGSSSTATTQPGALPAAPTDPVTNITPTPGSKGISRLAGVPESSAPSEISNLSAGRLNPAEAERWGGYDVGSVATTASGTEVGGGSVVDLASSTGTIWTETELGSSSAGTASTATSAGSGSTASGSTYVSELGTKLTVPGTETKGGSWWGNVDINNEDAAWAFLQQKHMGQTAGRGPSIDMPDLPTPGMEARLSIAKTPGGPELGGEPSVYSEGGVIETPGTAGGTAGGAAWRQAGEWEADLPGVPEVGGDVLGSVGTGRASTGLSSELPGGRLAGLESVGLETVSLESNSMPNLLGDIPDDPIMPFDMNALDLDSLPSESLDSLYAGFEDIASDPANFSMGLEGVGMGMGKLSSFLKARVTDAGVGMMLMPLFNYIDSATGTPWVSRSIQGTLAALGLALTGDPFGVIAAPITWGIQEYYHQRERLLDNDDPSSQVGKKFGYVREGDKWYPAILASRERDEGWIGSNKTQIRMQYGKNLRWRKVKGSTEYEPYFEDGSYKLKDFHVWDAEVDDPLAEAGKSYRDRYDPLRDFYFMKEDETKTMLQDMFGGVTVTEAEDGHEFTKDEQEAIKFAQTRGYGNFSVHDDVPYDASALEGNVFEDQYESWADPYGENKDKTREDYRAMLMAERVLGLLRLFAGPSQERGDDAGLQVLGPGAAAHDRLRQERVRGLAQAPTGRERQQKAGELQRPDEPGLLGRRRRSSSAREGWPRPLPGPA